MRQSRRAGVVAGATGVTPGLPVSVDAVDDLLTSASGHLRVAGNRQAVAAWPRHDADPRVRRSVAAGRLTVHRDRVVNQRLHSPGRQVRCQRVAASHSTTNRWCTCAPACCGRRQRRTRGWRMPLRRRQPAISRRRAVKLLQPMQALAQQGRLQLVEPAVHAELADARSARSGRSCAAGRRAVARARRLRDQRAAVADGAQVLGRIEAVRTGRRRSCRRRGHSSVPGATARSPRSAGCRPRGTASTHASMSSIWPYRCTSTTARVRGDRQRRTLSGDSKCGVGVDVGEHRRRAGAQDRQHGGEGRHRRRDHLVAGPDVQRAQRQLDRVHAVGHAEAVRACRTARPAPARRPAPPGPARTSPRRTRAPRPRPWPRAAPRGSASKSFIRIMRRLVPVVPAVVL